MLTPVIEILLFLSATFILGLALGWVLWRQSAKQEIRAIATERDFWKKSYDQSRLQSEIAPRLPSEITPSPAEPAAEPRVMSRPRTSHTKSRAATAFRNRQEAGS